MTIVFEVGEMRTMPLCESTCDH